MTAQAQHQELLNFPVNPGNGDTPVTHSELNDILNRLKWQYSQLNLKSGMTQYLTGSPGYFIGFSKNISNIADNTPVFCVGNPAGKNLAYNGINVILSGGVFILDTNNNSFQLCYGLQTGLCTDGNAVTFNIPYNNAPIVWFGPGGVTYDSTFANPSTTTQQQTFTANNVTGTGFTPYLKIQNSPTLTGQTINFGSLPSNSTTTTLNTTTAWDNNYTYNFSVNVASSPVSEPYNIATVSLNYSASGIAPFTAVYSFNCASTGHAAQLFGPFSFSQSISGLSASTSKLQITVTDNESNNSKVTAGATATYTSQTGATTHTVTPSGTSPIRWYAIAAPS